MKRLEHSKISRKCVFFPKFPGIFFPFTGAPVSASEDSNTIGNEELKALEALMLRLSKQGIVLTTFWDENNTAVKVSNLRLEYLSVCNEWN